MAHEHFNGTCEQSARNYHGAISRNFTGGKLSARLSCAKKSIPAVRAFSGCLVPMAYDEDCEIETERAIYIKGGYSRAKEVRAYVNETVVFAESAKTIGQVARKAVPDEVMQAIIGLRKARKQNDRIRLEAITAAFIMRNDRINKRLRKSFAAGTLDAETTLRKAGLITGRK